MFTSTVARSCAGVPARPVNPLLTQWFRLGRHDVWSTLPAAIRSLMQNGLLERAFEDALLPEFQFAAIADNEPWAANLGDTSTRTRTGLLAPKTTPVTGSDPSASTYAVEQWSVTMDQYGDSIDTNMMQSAMTIASKYLRDVQTLAIGAGQSLNQIARNKLYRAYSGGRTWATAGGSSDTSITVASVDGFTHVGVNGVPTPVSASTPLTVSIEGVANTVTGVSAQTGPGTLTLGTARADTTGDSVVAANAPVSYRPAAKSSANALTSSDTATLALFRNAVVRLRKQNVPTVGGFYVAHIPPDTEGQLFADPDFKQAAQGAVESPIYRNLSLGRFAGIDWVRNNETPTVTSATGVTVQRPLVVGEGALTANPFEGNGNLLDGTGVENNPNIRIIGPATGVQVALITRPPQDRFQQNLSTTWSWVGDFGVPSDATAASGDPARYKRAVMIEHAS
ncbi:hypothetical protein [Actinosynnema mirum]|uniref:Uncharacterized protein n=1 Tax=Actinosynnema mirum (strain ATCC 29888 / DSM 43827 / JCM 3225 / NBRC 14064 / NCIMB 13271 / NRRL B-12336 / IMRU 3971 / 101) TaxID=446462 RepID=C6WC53_ACTMD|nr:hypothetical protein [Actinosynnema mirum]ACU39441.1 conserved hypothetical protein [Actinosynnema mirum DSM 43827]